MDRRPVEIENAPCPLCGEDEAHSTPYTDGSVRVVRCASCRLWYLSPRLPEHALRESYAAPSYFEGGDSGYASYSDQEDSLRATFRRLVSMLAKAGSTGGSLLDVGCGYGFFLDEARDHFGSRTGIDMSATAAAKARSRADVVRVGGIETLPPDSMFNLITALHVIEHVYEPRAFVSDLRDRLAPGGSLLLATPDMGSFWRKLTGRRWPSFKYPEHVTFYDSGTLRLLIEAAGAWASIRAIAYLHAFPASQVAAKLGLPLPSGLGRKSVWFPATTVALLATL